MDPIDGYQLATALDDIVDFAEQAADNMGLFGVEAPMEQASQMGDVLVGAGEQVARALRSLRTGADLAPYLVEIHRLENEGDRISRDGVASLFVNGIDPMVVIRWKDIFASLEASVDACEHVAHVLEGITPAPARLSRYLRALTRSRIRRSASRSSAPRALSAGGGVARIASARRAMSLPLRVASTSLARRSVGCGRRRTRLQRFEVVDDRGRVGRVDAQRRGQLAHRHRLARQPADRPGAAEADPQRVGDLAPPLLSSTRSLMSSQTSRAVAGAESSTAGASSEHEPTQRAPPG